MNILYKILVGIGSGTILGGVYWLIRRLVDAAVERKAEEFRIRFQHEADVRIENLRNALQMIAYEQQVRFSKLHEKRAEIIANLYAQIVALPSYAWKFVLQSPTDVELAQKASEKVTEVDLFVATHRIYFPPDVCELLDEFVKTLRSMVIQVQVYWSDRTFIPQEHREAQNKVMLKAISELENEVPTLTTRLETEFRSLLGGPSTNPPNETSFRKDIWP